jgi:hypothetical protein
LRVRSVNPLLSDEGTAEVLVVRADNEVVCTRTFGPIGPSTGARNCSCKSDSPNTYGAAVSSVDCFPTGCSTAASDELDTGAAGEFGATFAFHLVE